ncbi:oxidoreductase [Rhizobium sp. BK251]|uniref:oxidoreductase n=1 Tax=Rhizobium sp. BK251 TaxID=2512125 RepID=UPI001048AFFE|nr:oxidoreductase [Rhizobium sp. BK251]TCL71218.1 NAD(P)-dependent dehydrogenase (short-subunit alcohol dehydrogenase family) [Rhizobium sp. BK251]
MTSIQAPIGSGFGASSTTEDVIKGIDLTGKNAIVTGGYAGLGLETVRTLSSAGARITVPTRDRARAEEALAGIRGVTVETMDLLDPASIDAFAQKFLATGQPLHFLINNAGIMANPLTRDARGFESQFATNHLGHFQLTVRLWPALKKAGGARVVCLTSRGHKIAAVDFDDPNFERTDYDRWAAYGRSKSANALFAVGLDKRGEPFRIRAFSVHPGGIVTGLAKFMSREEIRAVGAIDDEDRPVIDPANNRKTVEQGAATSIWCATSPRLEGRGGAYCEDCDISPALEPDATERLGVMPWATDPVAAEKLWDLSETLTGVRFQP